MLEPKEAYQRLCASGPFDDPTMSWYPWRWYFAADGVMCSSAWRDACPRRYMDFVKPETPAERLAREQDEFAAALEEDCESDA